MVFAPPFPIQCLAPARATFPGLGPASDKSNALCCQYPPQAGQNCTAFKFLEFVPVDWCPLKLVASRFFLALDLFKSRLASSDLREIGVLGAYLQSVGYLLAIC